MNKHYFVIGFMVCLLMLSLTAIFNAQTPFPDTCANRRAILTGLLQSADSRVRQSALTSEAVVSFQKKGGFTETDAQTLITQLSSAGCAGDAPNHPMVNKDANECFDGGTLRDCVGDVWNLGWQSIRYRYGLITQDNLCSNAPNAIECKPAIEPIVTEVF